MKDADHTIGDKSCVNFVIHTLSLDSASDCIQVFAVLGAALITLEYGRLGKSHWCLTELLFFTCRDLWKVFVLGCFFGQVLYMMPCLKAIYW